MTVDILKKYRDKELVARLAQRLADLAPSSPLRL